jgi:hypothetical protein
VTSLATLKELLTLSNPIFSLKKLVWEE